MISVADLLIGKRVPGNYYAPDTYVRGELEMGLLENRRGDRLMAIPPSLIQGLYAGLEKETGAASRLVLFNCGRRWGKHFFNRFRDEITDYYGTALVDMSMAEFLQAWRNCWATYGWGKLQFDQSYQAQGWIIIQTQNSAFARQAPSGKHPVCSLEAGILSAFLTQLSGQELYCLQTACESLGAEQNQFVIGLRDRLEPAQIWVDQQLPHAEIIKRLSLV
jgi:uncharacterized protein